MQKVPRTRAITRWSHDQSRRHNALAANDGKALNLRGIKAQAQQPIALSPSHHPSFPFQVGIKTDAMATDGKPVRAFFSVRNPVAKVYRRHPNTYTKYIFPLVWALGKTGGFARFGQDDAFISCHSGCIAAVA